MTHAMSNERSSLTVDDEMATAAPEPTGVLNRGSWTADAACSPCNADDFFAEGAHGIAHAVAVCVTCTVQTECLQFALDHDERYGIWGGTTPHQRHRLAQARAGNGDELDRNDYAPPAA